MIKKVSVSWMKTKGNYIKAFVHCTGELKAMMKKSQAKIAECDMLQSEFMYFTHEPKTKNV